MSSTTSSKYPGRTPTPALIVLSLPGSMSCERDEWKQPDIVRSICNVGYLSLWSWSLVVSHHISAVVQFLFRSGSLRCRRLCHVVICTTSCSCAVESQCKWNNETDTQATFVECSAYLFDKESFDFHCNWPQHCRIQVVTHEPLRRTERPLIFDVPLAAAIALFRLVLHRRVE